MTPATSFSTFWTHFFPPRPKFTDKDVPDLTGKVCVVTGSNTGIGKDVARILYLKNARVYMACRSEQKALRAIDAIRTDKEAAHSRGELIFLPLDLCDLSKTRNAAQSLVKKEDKIHVLFNNAGVLSSPGDPWRKTKQGYDIALGVNCVATFLFTRLLTPTLAATAQAEQQPNTVRVIWLSSFGLELEGVGVVLDNIHYEKPESHTRRYGLSKTGAWALGVEYARRHSRSDGIVSVPLNPGNLRSELARDQGIAIKILVELLCYPVINGAYTELFAAFSPEVTVESDWSKEWIIPFGRFYPLRPDLPKATKTEAEGGTGGVSKFWEWCEDQVKEYL
ncbi:NAD(P)-binding protein [Cryphonectria parasitica EP155]|uniref:NAD(P)-binding protein n=1 Tax=Cryphonectria parasitica (strain ATCC 38755 / EP155) TaxID=660469 RepID=A0A9P4Y5Q8_CRYP1|nr:NAD(P)-binding protein [Cryphonectria parasitica EP155]KAF3766605.1 NAD(P)-binding protein [Cryphonectria parasitica EP155]